MPDEERPVEVVSSGEQFDVTPPVGPVERDRPSMASPDLLDGHEHLITYCVAPV
jgi:hypothetical protein